MFTQSNQAQQLDFYKQILNSLQQAVIVTDNEAKIIFWNKYAEILYEYTSFEALGKCTVELISPANSTEQHTENITQIQQGDVSTTEYMVKNKSGREFPVKVNISPMYNSENKIIAFIGISEEISTQKKNERLLIESEKKYRSLFECATDAIFIADANSGIITDVNNSGEQLIGYQRNEIIGKHYTFLHPDNEAEKYIEKFEEAKNSENKIFDNIFFKHKSGKHIPIEAKTAGLVEIGNQLLHFGIFSNVSERKQYEQALKNSEEKFRNLAENSTTLIYRIGLKPEFHFEYVSPSATRITGYTPEEHYQNPQLGFEIVHPDDRQHLADTTKYKNGEPLVLRWKRKDGAVIWTEQRNLLIFNENNEPYAIEGSARDITETKLAEIELFRSKEYFKAIFEQATAGIAIVFSTGKISNVNPKFAQILGYSQAELLKLSVADITFHDDLIKEQEFAKQVMKGEINSFNIEKRYLHKTGKEIWVNLSATTVRNENAEIQYFIGVIIDITAQKQSEIELKTAKEKAEQSEARFRILFEKTPDVVVISNTKGEFIECNENFMKFNGLKTCEEVKNLTTTDCYVNKEEKENFVTELHNSGSLKNRRVKFKNLKTNEIVQCSASVEILKFRDEEPIYITSIRDISEMEQQAQELKQAKEKAEESDHLKSAFLRNISHEIRTPMNAICGFTDLLLKPNLPETKQKHFADIIHKSVNQLLNIIENTVTISFIETNQLIIKNIEFNPNNLLSELLDDFAHIKNKSEKPAIELKINIDNNLQNKITCDYTRLKQIFNVLLDNALKFTNEGHIEFGYQLGNQQIIFYVEDTGIGIPQEKQQIIFKSFAQADDTIRQLFGGVGLGLSIAVGLIKLIGGQLKIESHRNCGSRISFALPINLNIEQTQIQTNNNKNMAELANKIILVAEDEELNFQYIEELLADKKLEIIHALNGKLAVDICKNQKVDLILMDIKMPVMDGMEATEEIRKFNKKIPIIAQTAFSFKRETCFTVGFTDYLSKPFFEEQLSKILIQYIDI